MRRVLLTLSDLVLVLFLLMIMLSISLDLMMIRLGDRQMSIFRGVEAGVTNISVTDAKVSCPQGALAIVKRCTVDQAQTGDGILYFAADGLVTSGVFQGLQDGFAVFSANQEQIRVGPDRVKARYSFVLPGGYDFYVRMTKPLFIGAAGAFTFALFVLLRIDWRHRHELLSPTDGEISTMFK